MLRRNFLTALLLTITACSTDSRGPSRLVSQSEPPRPAIESININIASVEELHRIPHVGESMAQKIIEHREKYGPFRRPEHLMLIQGMSDVRFRRIRHLIRVE
jgi:competence protein ComEA